MDFITIEFDRFNFFQMSAAGGQRQEKLWTFAAFFVLVREIIKVLIFIMHPTNKEYVISFTEGDGYLFAHVAAHTVSEQIVRGYLRELADKSVQTGKDRVLLFRDIEASLSEGTLFLIVKDFLETYKNIRLAVVNPYADIDIKIGFALDVGHVRGYSFRMFSDVDTAKEWLLR